MNPHLLIFLLITNIASSQEWKNINSYKKEFGNTILDQGNWLKKDRKRNNERWKNANLYNLQFENGDKKYKTISQKRDFYLWVSEEIKKQGHEINWIGNAYIAADQLSKMDKDFIRIFIVRNKELVKFVNEGSEKVLSFAYPQLKDLYFTNELLKGKHAELWDEKYGKSEQCIILQPLYDKLSSKALKRLDRMAKGKGIFYLGVPKDLRYTGSINDCILRYQHGINKLLPYYIKHNFKHTLNNFN